MSSRSSSRRPERPLVIGRVAGARGPGGEMTVRVASGVAARWQHLERVLIAEAEPGRPGRVYDVERARGYRDRLVLKLAGVDGAGAARMLRGRQVMAPPEQVPALPEGVHYAARLVGLSVTDDAGTTLGTVVDVVPTGGVDVLVVAEESGHEMLVPMAREIVHEVREEEGIVRVRLPEGLRELNREVAPRGGRRREKR